MPKAIRYMDLAFVLIWITVISFINGDLKVNNNEVEKEESEMSTLSESVYASTQEEMENFNAEEDYRDKILFVPTKDWQEVKSYHKIPAGLHIRMNLETGVKEAKLLSDEGGKEIAIPYNSVLEKEDSSVLEEAAQPNPPNLVDGKVMLRQNLMEALKNIRNEDSTEEQPSEKQESPLKIRKKPKYRSYDTLKEEFKGLHLNIESDSDILNRLIVEYGQTDDEVRVGILEDLDFLAHQIDNAVNFVNMGGIKKIIEPGLNSTNAEIRKGVMRLLGSASQSNPKVQIAAFEEGLLNQLLRVVARERDSSISSKAVFAVSCLIRGFPHGQKRLIESGGLHTLREVFLKKDWQALILQLKVVSLIQDLLEERVNAEGDRRSQLNQLNLTQWLVEGEWCSAVSSLLTRVSFGRRGRREDLSAALGREVPIRPDHDMVDKVVNAMALLVPSCCGSFLEALPLLRALKDTYSDLAYKERFQGQDGHEFFQGLANQIQFLLLKIPTREEL